MSEKEKNIKKTRDLEIGLALSYLRKDHGWMQQEAARAFRCSVKSWNRWECGQWPKKEGAAIRLRIALSLLFGKDPDYLEEVSHKSLSLEEMQKGQLNPGGQQDISIDEEEEIDELGETFKHIYRTTKHEIVREAMKQYMRVLKELDKSTDQRGSGTS